MEQYLTLDLWEMQLRMKLHLSVCHTKHSDRGGRRHVLTIEYKGEPPDVPAAFEPLVIERHHYTPRRGNNRVAPYGSIVLTWRTEK